MAVIFSRAISFRRTGSNTGSSLGDGMGVAPMNSLVTSVLESACIAPSRFTVAPFWMQIRPWDHPGRKGMVWSALQDDKASGSAELTAHLCSSRIPSQVMWPRAMPDGEGSRPGSWAQPSTNWSSVVRADKI